MNAPLVTVIVAAYRTDPAYLREAIAGALAQTVADLEIVVSDDSPDDSLGGVVRAFGDRRLRYEHNVQALGVARNHGLRLQEARSPYLSILNHDDRWASTFLERLLAPLQVDDSVALSFCDHWVIDGRGMRLEAETERLSQQWGRAVLAPGCHRHLGPLLLQQTIPLAMGTVFRSDRLHGHLPDRAGPAYDLWLTYMLCRGGNAAYYVPERLSEWRSHEQSLTAQAGLDWAFGSATCWDAVAGEPAFADVAPEARRHAALMYYECARAAHRMGDLKQCRTFAKQSLSRGYSWRGVYAAMLGFAPFTSAVR